MGDDLIGDMYHSTHKVHTSWSTVLTTFEYIWD